MHYSRFKLGPLPAPGPASKTANSAEDDDAGHSNGQRAAKAKRRGFRPQGRVDNKVSKRGAGLRVIASTEGFSLLEPDPNNVLPGWDGIAVALGVEDRRVANALVMQIGEISNVDDKTSEIALNRNLALTQGIAPRDSIEAMLSAQMVAIHNATMAMATQLREVRNIAQQDSAAFALARLARTFSSQVDALQRYRDGRQQKLSVENVHVHGGGQAIVGNLSNEAECRD